MQIEGVASHTALAKGAEAISQHDDKMEQLNLWIAYALLYFIKRPDGLCFFCECSVIRLLPQFVWPSAGGHRATPRLQHPDPSSSTSSELHNEICTRLVWGREGGKDVGAD
jgi:hypothetical protein